MYLFGICITIVCYCVVLLMVVGRKSIFYHLRNIFTNPIRFIPLLALGILVASLFASCTNGNPGDHTGENWIMLIALLLCWLKG